MEMARETIAQRIQRENEEVALGYFDEALRELADPRRRQGLRYPLRTVVVTALMAMVCGCDDAEAMELWGKANEPWLETFLELPHGAPTQDVFLSVLGALEPSAFQKVYQRWAHLVSLRLEAGAGKHIAIDGKTSRRSGDQSEDKSPIHTVSAYLSGAGVVLSSTQVRDKENEIVAIPEVLAVLDLRGATVTLDAIGCQTDIAEAIVQGGGEYVLAVKENQPSLRDEVEETFAEADDPRPRALDEPGRPEVFEHQETTKNHGRIETRRVRVTSDLDWILSKQRWPGLGFVVEVHRQRTLVNTGKTSTETAYYIGSGTPHSVAQIAQHIRGHWAVENELHWVLDLAFREDEARHRAKNAAANMATLRHFALALVKQDATRKVGVANSRKRAAFDRSYLVQLIRGAASPPS
jgi:predicted transposase YbfD/YdcC